MMAQTLGLNKQLWKGIFHYLPQEELVACTYVSQFFRTNAQMILRQRAFVKACVKGDVERMVYLIQRGANPALPDDLGNCPMSAVLLSLNMKAIMYLDEALGVRGDVVWQRIDWEVLTVNLSHMRPHPLKATGGSAPNHYLTHGDLYRCYKSNEAHCKAYYDYQFGEGRWDSMLEALTAFAPGDRASEFYLYEDRELMGGPIVIRWCESIQMATAHVNKKVDRVAQFAQERVTGNHMCSASLSSLASESTGCSCLIS